MLCGCVREQFIPDSHFSTVYVSVEPAETRARLGQEGSGVFRIHWEEGDRISVISSEGNIPFTLTSGAGTGKATFHNEAGIPAEECFAVYPYEASTTLTGSTITLSYPAELTYDASNGRVKGGEYMAAVSSNGSFQFRNIHSYLRMTFTSAREDELNSIVIAELNGAAVSGTADIRFVDGIPEVKMTGSGKEVTVLMNGTAIGPSNPLTIDVPLAPVFTSGVKITLNGRNCASRTFMTSTTIDRNCIVTMSSAPFTKNAVAMINSEEYAEIGEALTKGVSKYRNPVVTLLQDTEYNGRLTVSGDHPVTLDLAGHTLKLGSLIMKAKTMKLTDSSADGTGLIESTVDKTIHVVAGELTIEAGTLRSKDSSVVLVRGTAEDAPHLIFNGGTMTSTNAISYLFAGDNGTIDMHGGSIVVKSGRGINVRSSGSGIQATANVDGGSITGNAEYLFYAYVGARINVTDGFFKTEKGRIIHNGTSNSDVRVYLKGGHYYAKGYPAGKYISGYNATSVRNIYVSGGYFNVDPIAESANACSDRPLAINGRGVVTKLTSPVSMNGTKFPYAISVDNSRIVVGYSQNGTSNVTREAFMKAFADAGASVDFFEDYATTDNDAKEYVSRVDALVIPGSATSDASIRSACDQRLIRAAISQGKPVLGVCYGHQRICLVKGGKVPSVANTYPTSTIVHKEVIDGVNSVRIKELHSITIDKNSILYSLLGEETIMVNSSHNYCCTISNGNLKVVATAPDGCCEALEGTTAGECLLGVQFHPEYLYSAMGRTKFLAIFKYIVDSARTTKENKD